MVEEEDFKVVEEVGVEIEEAEFKEDGIKVVEVATKIKMEVITAEVVTRIEVVVMEVAIRIEGEIIKIEEVVVVMVGATRIEGVAEVGVVVAEEETIIINII